MYMMSGTVRLSRDDLCCCRQVVLLYMLMRIYTNWVSKKAILSFLSLKYYKLKGYNKS